MKNITPELIAQAKAAKSEEELKAIANANNIEITDEETKVYYNKLHTHGFVDDDELELVAGGEGCGDDKPFKEGTRVHVRNGKKCPGCESTTGRIFNDFGRRSYSVKCYNCGGIICTDVTEDDVVII